MSGKRPADGLAEDTTSEQTRRYLTQRSMPSTRHCGPWIGEQRAATATPFLWIPQPPSTRMRADTQGPGQRFAIAAGEACSRTQSRNNEVTLRWVPAHHGVTGNEVADGHARAAASMGTPNSAVPGEYRWGTSLSHIARVSSEAKSRTSGE